MIDYPGLILIFVLLSITMPVYLLPSIMAREKNNFNSVLLLNVLLGWTVIAWIISLIWALRTEKDPLRSYKLNTHNCCPKIEAELTKLRNLFRAGAITKTDYHNETRKIIGN